MDQLDPTNFRAFKSAVSLKQLGLLALAFLALHFRAFKSAVSLKLEGGFPVGGAAEDFRAFKSAVSLKPLAAA